MAEAASGPRVVVLLALLALAPAVVAATSEGVGPADVVGRWQAWSGVNGITSGASLERSLARLLLELDERLDLGTFPDGSPLWPARFAASLDRRAESLQGEGVGIAPLMQELAGALRQLGVERGLTGPVGGNRAPVGAKRADLLERALRLAGATRRALDGVVQEPAAPSRGSAADRRGAASAVIEQATISGVITDAVTGAPLAGYVHRYGSSGEYLDTVVVEADGTYTTAGLAAGTYLLRTEVDGYRDEIYDDVPFESLASFSSATPLSVAGGEILSGIDFALGRYPSIEGTLNEQGTMTPIAREIVALFDDGASLVENVWTAADGSFGFTGLEPGTYFVRTSTHTHRNKLYDDISCTPTCTVLSGTPVEVSLNASATGIDFVLLPLGRVSGTVREVGTGKAVAHARLGAYNSQSFHVYGATTAADGSYRIDALPTGTYFIKTDSDTHVNEVYDNRLCDPFCDPRIGNAVATVDGSTTTGIDFVLQRRGSISGRVTHSVSGAAIPGAGILAINSTFSFTRSATAAADGTYVLPDLPPDGYYVRTAASDYRNELYDDLVCTPSCPLLAGNLVTARAATETSGIDFGLDRLGSVAGRVTARDTGSGLGLAVQVISPNGNIVASGWSPGGDFRIGGLEPGTYYVKTFTDGNVPEYQDELFDGVPCEPSCDLMQGSPVSVGLNVETVGVNLTLIPCPHDTDLSLSGFTSFGVKSFGACERIGATDMTVRYSADVTFKAGRAVALGDGFRVESGASFRVVIEPAWTEP